ncbi:unnamed protein product [Mycena citricolor]|uniref:Cytochrome P450 n=1 Tax=Mycena citricolor TaxID=2018698 RepID=A0AAD2K7I4_9AGAR|nr:unnamed protein product [Mycena citricolor]
MDVVLALACTAALTALIWCQRRLRARRLGAPHPLHAVPGPAADTFLAGNLARLHGPDGWDFHAQLERDFRPGVVKIHGLAGSLQLYVYDPVALHSILVKDAESYEEGLVFLSLTRVLFGTGILSTTGATHRRHRKIMMPAFSPKHLRGMVPALYEVACRLRDGLVIPQIKDGVSSEIDLYPCLSRVSLEFIGRAGADHSFDPLSSIEDPTDNYTRSLKAITPCVHKLAVLLPFVPLLANRVSPWLRRALIRVVPRQTSLGTLCDAVRVTDRRATELVHRAREGASQEHRHDVLSLLMQDTEDDESPLMTEELVAQISMIVQAGTDTTSSALNRVILVLALNPEIQERLRAELLRHDERMDHDVLVQLPYLDAVVRETLRLYPPITAMSRTTTRECILPLSEPLTDTRGQKMNQIRVPQGTDVYIAIAGANHNPAVWGHDALEFNPERWLVPGSEPSSKWPSSGVFGDMMTFLGGNRSCIGFRFAQLEIKIVLAVLLRSFKLSVSHPQRISWKMGSPAEPMVDGKAALPIVVERLY